MVCPIPFKFLPLLLCKLKLQVLMSNLFRPCQQHTNPRRHPLFPLAPLAPPRFDVQNPPLHPSGLPRLCHPLPKPRHHFNHLPSSKIPPTLYQVTGVGRPGV